jgi:hypothetical protein
MASEREEVFEYVASFLDVIRTQFNFFEFSEISSKFSFA